MEIGNNCRVYMRFGMTGILQPFLGELEGLQVFLMEYIM